MKKIVIIGSYRKHRDLVFRARANFIEDGAEVLRPSTNEIISVDGWVRLVGDSNDPQVVQLAQLTAIKSADAVYVVNPGGYIGPSGMLQIGYAHSRGVPVFAAEPAYEAGAQAVIQGVHTPGHVVALLEE